LKTDRPSPTAPAALSNATACDVPQGQLRRDGVIDMNVEIQTNGHVFGP
jgi:hypothetical protein